MMMTSFHTFCCYSFYLLLCLFVTSSSSTLRCNNLFGLDYETLDDYADQMCTYCLDTMIVDGHEKDSPVWVDRKAVYSWNVYFNRAPQWQKYTGWIYYNQTSFKVSYRQLKEVIETNKTSEHFVLRQFTSKYYMNTFMKCCDDAVKCCLQMNATQHKQVPVGICPRQWDGWNCWAPSPTGVVHDTCPDMSVYLMGKSPPRCLRSNAIKTCIPNGQWNMTFNEYYQKWMVRSNYDLCSYLGTGTRSTRATLVIILESISLVCATVGFVLFTFYHLYSQFRFQIHVNFFLSIIFSSLITVLYEIMVSKANLDRNYNFVLQTPALCRTVTFLFKDLRMVKYFWMVLEGINFHHMVVFPFNRLSQYKLYIYLSGWLLPQVIMLVYGLVRFKWGNDICWTSWPNDMDNLEWIYIVPHYLGFAINLILFINLVRVIVVKLLIPKNNYYSHFVKQGVKTSLVLLPIFGIQFLMHTIPVNSNEECNPGMIAFSYIQVIVECSQGIIVTTALCFLNKEVTTCVRKSISSMESSSILTSSNNLSEDSTKEEKLRRSS